jgi:hypothetical protein
LNIDGQQKVQLVEEFDSITQNGIYIKFSDKSNYNYYTIPEGVSYNP